MAVIPIAKKDEKRGLVYGWANIIKTAEGEVVVDSQGDIIDEDELDHASVQFMLHHRAAGEMHEGDAKGTIVEAFLASPSKLEAMGMPAEMAKRMPTGFWIGAKVAPELFAKFEDGTYKGFSIQGHGVRQPVEV